MSVTYNEIINSVRVKSSGLRRLFRMRNETTQYRTIVPLWQNKAHGWNHTRVRKPERQEILIGVHMLVYGRGGKFTRSVLTVLKDFFAIATVIRGQEGVHETAFQVAD